MKRSIVAILCAAACVITSSAALAQTASAPGQPSKTGQKAPETKPAPAKPASGDAPKADPKADPSAEAAMEAMAKPGPFHERLKSFEGEWQSVSTTYEADGSTKTSEGTITNKMVMGDRFIRTEYSGRMEGKFATGWGLTGFNNASQKFESVWADTMGTSMTFMTGAATKADAKSYSVTGDVANPAGAGTLKMRQLTHFPVDNAYTMEFFITVGKDEVKIYEIRLTKGAKKDPKSAIKDAIDKTAPKK
jgi:Protein of unknown function (DUF1579)